MSACIPIDSFVYNEKDMEDEDDGCINHLPSIATKMQVWIMICTITGKKEDLYEKRFQAENPLERIPIELARMAIRGVYILYLRPSSMWAISGGLTNAERNIVRDRLKNLNADRYVQVTKKHYEQALVEYSNIKPDHPEYEDIQTRMKEIESLLD